MVGNSGWNASPCGRSRSRRMTSTRGAVSPANVTSETIPSEVWLTHIFPNGSTARSRAPGTWSTRSDDIHPSAVPNGPDATGLTVVEGIVADGPIAGQSGRRKRPKTNQPTTKRAATMATAILCFFTRILLKFSFDLFELVFYVFNTG